MKMARRLRDVSEASSLCPPGRSKARRFAYITQPPAHFERNDVTIIYETVHQAAAHVSGMRNRLFRRLTNAATFKRLHSGSGLMRFPNGYTESDSTYQPSSRLEIT